MLVMPTGGTRQFRAKQMQGWVPGWRQLRLKSRPSPGPSHNLEAFIMRWLFYKASRSDRAPSC